MDTRDYIINTVQFKMQEKGFTENQLYELCNCLTIVLNDYEIQERCTDLIISDNSNDNILKQFIATKACEGKSSNTLKRYYDICYTMLHEIQKPIAEIQTYDLRFYLAMYQKVRGVSNSTLDGMRRCIRSFFCWAFAEDLIPKNPSIALAQIKSEKVIRKPFSDVDIELLKRSCTSLRDRAIVEFLYFTGCRVSEMVQLNISDINFKTKEVIVHGKGNKQRVVYLSDVCALYLSEYIESRTDNYPALFIGRGTDRLSKAGVEAMLKRLSKAAGVENVARASKTSRRSLVMRILKQLKCIVISIKMM